MRTPRILLAAALLFLMGTASVTDSDPERNDREILYRATAILFEVFPDKTEVPICSAWTINTLEREPGYYLATMSHCLGTETDVDGQTTNPLFVRWEDTGTRFPAQIISRGIVNEGHDYAVLAVRTTLRVPILPIGRAEDVKAGDQVVTVGSPVGLGKLLLFGQVAKPAILIPRVIPSKKMNWTGNMVTDLATAGGLSGAPIWSVKQRAVVALHVGTVATVYGVAVPISRMTPGRYR